MTLHDAIDQDKFIIDDEHYTDADFLKMRFDELATIKIRIKKKISGLSIAMKEKQFDRAYSGDKATKEWYISRRRALSINERVMTYIKYLMKVRRRTERTISECFMDQAKSILAPKDYQHILNNAHNDMEIMRGALCGK